MTYPTISVGVSLTTTRFATPSYTTLAASDVQSLDIAMGRKSELESLPPGSLEVGLDNRTRKYDPRNAAGAYYPNLTPGRKVRVTATYDEYDGNAAVSYVAAGALASGDNASLTPALPGGWLPYRDLFVCLASIRSSGTGTVNVPADWFTIASSGNVALLGHYAIAGDVAPTITFTGGATGDTTLAQVIALRDCEADPTNLVSASTSQLNASNQNIAVPSLTVSEGGVVLIAGWKQDDWTGVAPLSGQFFNEAIDASSVTGNDAGHVLDYRLQTGALNVNATNLVVTGGASAISRTIVVALRPYRGRVRQIFGGWTTGWPNKYSRWSGDATLRATGAFGLLARSTCDDPYALAIQADSPTGWYRLAETAAQGLTDSSGHGLGGRWIPEIAEVRTTTGLIRSSNSALSLPSAPAWAVGKIPAGALPSLRPLSVEFWVQLDAVPTGTGLCGLIEGGGIQVRVYEDANTTPGALQFKISDSADPLLAHTATASTSYSSLRWATVCDGRPHHVVCTFNGAGNLINVYIDGTDRAPFNTFSGTISAIPAWGIIDLNPGGTWAGNSNVLDEVAFYNVELTPTQVSNHFVAGWTAWSGDTTGARISRILTLDGWPASLMDVDVGQTVLGAFTGTDTKTLDYFNTVANTEQGWLSEAHDNAGAVRFVDRGARLTDPRSTTAQSFFSDNATDLASNGAVPYSAIGLATDDKPAANQVTVKWLGGEVVAADQSSIDTYGLIPVSLETVLELRDAAVNLAAWVLAEQSTLFTRVTSVTVKPAAMTGAAAQVAWPACFGRREGDRVRVVHQPASTGTALDQQLWIIGIEHHADDGANNWQTTFHLAPAITTAYWIVGTSQLGTNTRLAY